MVDSSRAQRMHCLHNYSAIFVFGSNVFDWFSNPFTGTLCCIDRTSAHTRTTITKLCSSRQTAKILKSMDPWIKRLAFGVILNRVEMCSFSKAPFCTSPLRRYNKYGFLLLLAVEILRKFVKYQLVEVKSFKQNRVAARCKALNYQHSQKWMIEFTSLGKRSGLLLAFKFVSHSLNIESVSVLDTGNISFSSKYSLNGTRSSKNSKIFSTSKTENFKMDLDEQEHGRHNKK